MDALQASTQTLRAAILNYENGSGGGGVWEGIKDLKKINLDESDNFS